MNGNKDAAVANLWLQTSYDAYMITIKTLVFGNILYNVAIVACYAFTALSATMAALLSIINLTKCNLD